ncbi:unnamed protein product [Protopolystoma xenopodis]|uniref:Uncharacterized protein n=1 Tax=Protopolystoma xenopodis TaxID=117903 RepID=A0A448XP33_9PLAT|nr:unnamed protein product [Protopolystoma xenopodis]
MLEDEITRLHEDDLITPATSTSSGIEDFDKTLQALRSNERLLKSKDISYINARFRLIPNEGNLITNQVLASTVVTVHVQYFVR